MAPGRPALTLRYVHGSGALALSLVCQAGASALSFKDYDLRDPGEVSHGAVGRSIHKITSPKITSPGCAL